MLLPSSIQRADDFVGMAMPTVPLPWAKAPVTAVAAMVAASARADKVVFRLVMLHSLDIEDLWFLDCETAQMRFLKLSRISRVCARLVFLHQPVDSFTSGSGRPCAATSSTKVRP